MQDTGDYISRDAAKKQMRNGRHSMEWLLASGAKTIGDSFEIILDEVPAADVRPAVRGKWKVGGVFDDIGRCSCCHYMFPLDTAMTEFHFCPNCGADMREES